MPRQDFHVSGTPGGIDFTARDNVAELKVGRDPNYLIKDVEFYDTGSGDPDPTIEVEIANDRRSCTITQTKPDKTADGYFAISVDYKAAAGLVCDPRWKNN